MHSGQILLKTLHGATSIAQDVIEIALEKPTLSPAHDQIPQPSDRETCILARNTVYIPGLRRASITSCIVARADPPDPPRASRRSSAWRERKQPTHGLHNRRGSRQQQRIIFTALNTNFQGYWSAQRHQEQLKKTLTALHMRIDVISRSR
ncbi:hypothetical protein OPT61_g9808 [Boeremia exigua]|uniref:Uncharacterized protein n=1 Tax=Boeremia exigua TaxID=749465 RepID=A0ACC2HSI4_9PLEO|nr:hypothetical protein OPT61_g9808 [Boeremia exigua]